MSNLKLPKNPVIIVGAGLAGLVAAIECIDSGANVIIVEKNLYVGGNSVKAASGISGTSTRLQRQHEIDDTSGEYLKDLIKNSGIQKDNLTSDDDNETLEKLKTISSRSTSTIDWLESRFGLKFDSFTEIEGHSNLRTLTFKKGLPGSVLVYSILKHLDEKISEFPQKYKLLTNCKMIDFILKNENEKSAGANNEVLGIKVNYKTEQELDLHGPVIMTTGGYGGDFYKNTKTKAKKNGSDCLADELLLTKKYLNYSTASSSQSTGDGIKLINKIGGELSSIDKIQTTPFGLVPFQDRTTVENVDTKYVSILPNFVKKYCMITNKKGERIVNNEFCCRNNDICDIMNQQINQLGLSNDHNRSHDNSCYMILNRDKVPKKIDDLMERYVSNGSVKVLNSNDLCDLMNISIAQLANQFTRYNIEFSQKYYFPDGDEECKCFLHNFFFVQDPKTNNQSTFYVSTIKPTVFLPLGGVKTDKNGKIPNLKNVYCAGEIMGGIHGDNMLIGTSLLGCAVYGRIAANNATKDLLSKLTEDYNNTSIRRLNAIKSHLTSFSLNKALETTSSRKEKLTADEINAFCIPSRVFTMEEVAKHNKPDDCWLVIKNVVVDFTSFLKRHPGGESGVLKLAGTDITDVFSKVHDDQMLINSAPHTIIGKLEGKYPYLEFMDDR